MPAFAAPESMLVGNLGEDLENVLYDAPGDDQPAEDRFVNDEQENRQTGYHGDIIQLSTIDK